MLISVMAGPQRMAVLWPFLLANAVLDLVSLDACPQNGLQKLWIYYSHLEPSPKGREHRIA